MKLDRRKIVFGLPVAVAVLSRHNSARGETATAAPPRESRFEFVPRRTAFFTDSELIDPRTQRRMQLRLRLPSDPKPVPLIVYSPGLGSGVSNGAAWCETWAKAGFAVATIAHPGTDDGLWDVSKRGLRENLSIALAHSQYSNRVRDCRFVIAHCLTAPETGKKIDPTRIGIAGHSFGALTVQALASEAAGDKGTPVIAAAIALSPGGRSQLQALPAVKIPFFCVTGDRDNYVTFGSGADATRLGMPLENRLAVYRHLPAGAKQLLILAKADHMTFAGEPVSPARYSRDVPSSPGESEAAWARISFATTAFWQYYLGVTPRSDRTAYIEKVKAQLSPADRFEAS
jgi:dienelactone hydrolase